MKLSFREMVPDDAAAVEQVEKACFAMPWSRESFWREAANENTLYLLAIDGEALPEKQVIGYVGSTGSATGNHLHFEIWTNSSSSSCVNPLNYF